MAFNTMTIQLRTQRGFTLLELMITVVIVGILTAIGVPALSSMLDNSKISQGADMLIASLGVARGQASELNARVAVCRSTDGAACSGTGDWRAGWIVFVDKGTIGTKDSADQILLVQPALKEGGLISPSGNVAGYISYLSNGQTRTIAGAALNGSLYVCGTTPKIKRRRLVLSPGSGIVDVQKLAGSATCTS
jgi:type IV fimbrial biogenesis protein FimT